MTNRTYFNSITKVSSNDQRELWGCNFPIGSIISWAGGYCTNSNNAGFTSPLFTNNIAQLKIFLSTYAPNWSVCDGTEPADPESPIFNSSGRYLPNLTDSRFLMGSTAAGTATNNSNLSSMLINNLPSHSHTSSVNISDNIFDHTHYIPPFNISSSSPDTHFHFGPATGASGDHQHYAIVWRAPPEGTGGPDGNWYVSVGNGAPEGNDVTGTGNSYHRHEVTSGTQNSFHQHSVNVNTVTNNWNHNHPGSSVSLSNYGSSTNFDITPKYFSCFYIIRTK